MQAASISKPLVAAAIMRLVDRGTLALSDSANQWLRSWKIPANALTAQTSVRVGQLLSHTAGATNGAVGIYPPGSTVPTLLQALDGTPPSNRPPVRIDTRPGTEWRYAGGGYSILQQMLIDVIGSPFPELMDRLVLTPAGMQSSCFCQPLPDSLASRAASGHDSDGKPIAGGWWTLPEMAAGGLWTTAGDLGQFLIAINRSWTGASDALVRKPTARTMLTPVLGGWGLGFAVDTVAGQLRYSHTGSNNGYRSVIVGYPARGDGIAILTNGDGGAALRDEILRAAAAEYKWPGYAADVRAVASSANRSLDDFAGRFQYAPRFVSTFAVIGDSLVGTLNSGPPTRLYPQAPDVFFTLVGSTYRFVRGATGSVESVVVLGVGASELRGRRLTP
jgi:CubicO group peptidase (beta-lactamase class C family)